MTKYDLMLESNNYSDKFGNPLPDILSYPINSFETSIAPKEYILSQNDINRFDLLIYKAYGILEYESFILAYNNIMLISRLEAGTKILLPNAVDIDSWIHSNIK